VRIAILQFAAAQGKQANLELIRQLARKAAAAKPDLVVFPEAGMYDFGEADTPLAPAAEPLDGPFVQAIGDLARDLGATIVGGMFEAHESDPERVFNTVVAVNRDGSLAGAYRKIHLYDAFGWRESDRLVPGDGTRVVVSVGDHRVGLFTCYDLRFPELARALAADDGADVLVVPAAWVRGPMKEDHWSTLVRARGIENTCYVVAAAQTPPKYSGRSMLVDPMGVVVAGLGEEQGVAIGDVDPERLASVRKRNPTLRHRRFAVTHRDG